MQESFGRMKIWTILFGCSHSLLKRFRFLQDHVSVIPMLRNLPAVLEYGMYAGLVVNDFRAFANCYNIREMFMNRLGISVSVARSFHGGRICTDMYRSLVRSVDRLTSLAYWFVSTNMFHFHSMHCVHNIHHCVHNIHHCATMCMHYVATCKQCGYFANINSSLSYHTFIVFRTCFDGEGLLMMEVILQALFPWPVAQRKWHEAWWKTNPRPSGQKWILIQFRGFFFHHASCHLLWPTSLGFTCPKSTSVIVKPSPLNKVRKTLRVYVERVYI